MSNTKPDEWDAMRSMTIETDGGTVPKWAMLFKTCSFKVTRGTIANRGAMHPATCRHCHGTLVKPVEPSDAAVEDALLELTGSFTQYPTYLDVTVDYRMKYQDGPDPRKCRALALQALEAEMAKEAANDRNN